MAVTSVVVVSHDPGDWLARCLASVSDQADEVIVVDNGSPEGRASRAAFTAGVRLVRSDANRGFAGGANLGLGYATGDFIALLNDDAMADANWIKASEAQLTRAGDVVAVVPKLLLAPRYAEIRFDEPPHWAEGDPRPLGRCIRSLTVDGIDRLAETVGPGLHRLETGLGRCRWRWTTGSEPFYVPVPAGLGPVRCNGELVEPLPIVDLINNAGSYLSAEGHGGDYGYETPDRGQFDRPRDCFAASGAALVTTAEALQRIGPFASSFFAYYEDTDWSWRAQLHGMRIRYEPSVVVRHLRSATTGGQGNPRVQFFANRNRLLTLIRNAPGQIAAGQLRAARSAESWPSLRRSLLKRIPQAWLQRQHLARGWQRSAEDVWREWAGVDESWPHSGTERA